MNDKKIIKAGKIASDVKKYIKPLIKKGTPLLEIANKIDDKIIELGGKAAFPVNLSIDEIAAHYTPSHDDETLASGILKVDLGVHIDGWTADTAFSMDLEDDLENKKLIETSQQALDNAIKNLNTKTLLMETGKIIQDTIEKNNFSSIVNLSGHSMDKFELHSGKTIPNYDNKNTDEFGEGLFAIEPFATNGNGKVRDGKPSGIYVLIDPKNVRSPIAREILHYVLDEYQTLPFCSRWLVKKFGVKALFGLKQLEENGNFHQYPQLIETGNGKVSQAENSILINKDKILVTTDQS